jgi:hypothetical protein
MCCNKKFRIRLMFIIYFIHNINPTVYILSNNRFIVKNMGDWRVASGELGEKS